MRLEDKLKTSFIVPNGLYCWKVMPFGAKNSPATFQRTIDRIFSSVSIFELARYLDDLLCQGTTEEHHLQILEKVLQILWNHNLKAKSSKCNLFKKKLVFLGHVISKEGLQCEETKTEAIRNYPTPTSVKEVRQALGLFSFYRRHVQGFSAIAKPLHQLTSKSVKFEWTPSCEQAFRELIKRLTSAPTLVNPRPGEQLILTTDSSNFAIGAVLHVIRDGKRHPVSFGSHLLNAAQCKYSATKRELLAIVYFAQAFKFYLLGQPEVIFETDHRPLTWLASFHDPPAIISRWVELISPINYKIVFRAGSQNQAADALSRISITPSEASTLERAKIQLNLISDKIEPRSSVDDVLGEQPVDNLEPEDQLEGEKLINRLGKEQKKDPALKRLYEILFEKKPMSSELEPPLTMFYYHKRENIITLEGGQVMAYLDTDGSKRLLVPYHKRQEVLKSVHSGATGGHRSAAKMLTVLKHSFYWKTIRYDCELFAKNCYSCGTLKKPPKRPNAALTMTGTSSRLQKIAIDLVGKLPRTKRGNVFFLSVLDCFTKFVWAFPMSKITAEDIADKLVTHVFSVFGLPLQVCVNLKKKGHQWV